MESLPIANPFPGAVSFIVKETSSTQEEAKRLARLGFLSGSLVAAEIQSSGRGRLPERRWESESGKNLLFTLRLDPSYARLPALPLRVGAALAMATSIQAIRMGIGLRERRPLVKWPNDLLVGGRKAAGVLCEASTDGVYIGIGVNCNQAAFPGEIGKKATSLAIELGAEIDRWAFLEILLGTIKDELAEEEWKAGVEELLWRRGERVAFIPGLPPERASGSGETIEGVLEGIDPSGSLLIRPIAGAATAASAATAAGAATAASAATAAGAATAVGVPLAFAAGELLLHYGSSRGVA